MTGLLPILASTQLWEIEEITSQGLIQVLGMVLSGDQPFATADFQIRSTRPQYRQVNSDARSSEREYILIQPIQGVMMSQNQSCGPEGMTTISRRITAAMMDPEIRGLVLDIDSPGGAANGSGELARAIAEFAQAKPVVSYVRGMAASAALKTAIAANHVMMGGAEAEIGSVGTVISYWDLSEHYRRQDIRFVEVASSNTPDKRGYNFLNPSPADLQKIDEEILTPHSERFQSWVRQQRPNVKEDTLTGKMYYADQALENGLADSIGTFNEALQLVQQLSQSDMFKSKKPKTEAPKAAATVPAPVAEETTSPEPVSREEFEALQTQMQETQQNQQTMLTQLKTMTGVLERLSKLPANEVADPKGDEGVAVSDEKVGPVTFGNFYEEERQAYKEQTGLA